MSLTERTGNWRWIYFSRFFIGFSNLKNEVTKYDFGVIFVANEYI